MLLSIILSCPGAAWAELERRSTELLALWAEEAHCVDAAQWEDFAALLEAWESAPQSDLAVSRYLGLLQVAAERLRHCAVDTEVEREFQEFLRRGLNLRAGQRSRGEVLFHLVESRLRYPGGGLEAMDSVEQLLIEALDLLGDEAPAAAVLKLLVQISIERARANPESAGIGERRYPYTRAVDYLGRLKGFAEADTESMMAIEQAEVRLLEPAAGWDIRHRYLPQTEIRFALRTRNLETIQIEIHRGDEVIRQFVQQVEVLPVGRHDWTSTLVSVGDQLPRGSYRAVAKSGDLSIEADFLVTSVEILAMVEPRGNLVAWVMDAITGHPVESANLLVTDDTGQLLDSATVSDTGKIRFPVSGIDGWAKLEVESQGQQLAVHRDQLTGVDDDLNLVLIPQSLMVLPGQTLNWLVVPATQWTDAEALQTLLLPDGRELSAREADRYGGIIRMEALIPQDLKQAGPLFLQSGDGKVRFLTRVMANEPHALTIQFEGDRLRPHLNLFHAGTDILITALPESSAPLPGNVELCRLRVYQIERSTFDTLDWESPLRNARLLVLEQVISVSPDQHVQFSLSPGRLPLNLPFNGFVVEITDLEAQRTLASQEFGLTRFSGEVKLRTNHRIAQVGEKLVVDMEFRDWRNRPTDAIRRGQLVVVRETWESRYVHRRRGTLITEEAYLALPERSLLGSARTDYVLSEEGRVREEFRRFEVVPSADRTTVSIEFSPDRGGVYSFAFLHDDLFSSGGNPDTHNPVFVMPDSADLRVFRADGGRLIVEPSADARTWELLLLANRQSATALIAEHFANGSVSWRSIQFSGPGLYLSRSAPADEPIVSIEAFVIGDQRNLKLSHLFPAPSSANLRMDADERSGLNPGASFSWKISHEPAGAADGYWFIHRRGAGMLIHDWVANQLTFKYRPQRFSLPSLFLADKLPFFQAIPLRAEGVEKSFDPGNSLFFFSDAIRRFSSWMVQPDPFETVFSPLVGLTGESGVAEVSGRLPDQAGQWDLVVLSQQQPLLALGHWALSTERPFESSLSLATKFRRGDKLSALLRVTNQTEESVTIDLALQLPAFLSLDSALSSTVQLGPLASFEEQLELSVSGIGSGALSAIATTDDREVVSSVPVTAFADNRFHRMEIVRMTPGQTSAMHAFSLLDLEMGKLIVTDNLAALIGSLWLELRGRFGPRDLAGKSLMDHMIANIAGREGWAVPELAEASFSAAPIGLLNLKEGGLVPRVGMPPDVRYTAVILAAVKAIGPDGLVEARMRQPFADQLQGMSQFLGSAMIDPQRPDFERLLALHAQLDRPSYPAFTRPTRLQAREFLNLFSQRQRFGPAEMALLLDVARRFAFPQEVEVLAEELAPMASRVSNLWEASLVINGLLDLVGYETATNEALNAAMTFMGKLSPVPGWRDLAALLQLTITASLQAQIHSGPSPALLLNGRQLIAEGDFDDSERPAWKAFALDLESDGSGQTLTLEARGSTFNRPVLAALYGRADLPEKQLPIIAYRQKFTRLYEQETLLRGRSEAQQPLENVIDLRAGDQLRAAFEFELLHPEDVLEIKIPIPTGTRIDPDLVRVIRGTGSSVDFAFNPDHSAQSDHFTIYLNNLTPDRYELQVGYPVIHGADSVWRPIQLRNPFTGELRLPEASARLPITISR